MLREMQVQEVTGKQEDIVGTDSHATDTRSCRRHRQMIVDRLTATFGQPSSGKYQYQRGAARRHWRIVCAILWQPPAIPIADQQLATLAANIVDYRKQHSGLIRNLDELRSVPGVTPQVLSVLKQQSYAGSVHVRSAEVVGPKIGAELQRKAILAVLYALGGMLVYIAFRFEWIYGVAAVMAVFHDTIITIGLFSLFNKEISLTVVAALLTLVGYSMNDTIVMFDRIRENLKILRRETLETLINISVNQTLSRTVLTCGPDAADRAVACCCSAARC